MKRKFLTLALALVLAIAFSSGAFAATIEPELRTSGSRITIRGPMSPEMFAQIAAFVPTADPNKLVFSVSRLTDAEFSKICESYPNMVELYVSNGFDGSKSATGLTSFAPLNQLAKAADTALGVKADESPGVTGITSLAPLTKLTKLTALDLREFPVDRAYVLDVAGATQLKKLFIINNKGFDLSGIAKLTSLEYLAIIRSGLTDISWITNLTNLKTLSLGSSPLADYSPIAKSTITEFQSSHAEHPLDLAVLGALKNLANVRISRQDNVTNWGALSGLTSLKHFYLDTINEKSGGPVDLSFMKTLTGLQFSAVQKCAVTNFEALEGAKALVQFNIEASTGITSLAPLKGLPQLSSLRVVKGAFSAEEQAGFTNKRFKVYERN